MNGRDHDNYLAGKAASEGGDTAEGRDLLRVALDAAADLGAVVASEVRGLLGRRAG